MNNAETSSSDQALFTAALALEPQQRGELAAKLLKSLDDLPPGQRRSAEQWQSEIDRRVESGLSGEPPGVSYDDAVAGLRAAARGE